MSTPNWASLPADHDLVKFAASLQEVLSSVGYNEMYGVSLENPTEGYCSRNCPKYEA